MTSSINTRTSTRLKPHCADAVRFYNAHHLGLPTKLFRDVADECIAAKEAAGISTVYRRSLRHYLGWMKRDFGPQPVADITTQQVDAWLREANVTVPEMVSPELVSPKP